MPSKNEKTPEDLFDFNVVRLWKTREHAKAMRQLQSKLSEFLNDLKTAQSLILERTEDEYKERTAGFFVNHLGAIELSLTLVRTAADGILFSPKGWQKQSPKPVDPATN